jgi:hypothetical protein
VRRRAHWVEPRDTRQPVAHPPNPYALDPRAPRARLDADTLADLTCSDMLEGMLVLPQLAEPARSLSQDFSGFQPGGLQPAARACPRDARMPLLTRAGGRLRARARPAALPPQGGPEHPCLPGV